MSQLNLYRYYRTMFDGYRWHVENWSYFITDVFVTPAIQRLHVWVNITG